MVRGGHPRVIEEWMRSASRKRLRPEKGPARVPLGAAEVELIVGYGDAHELWGLTDDQKLDRPQLRHVFTTLVERVELDPVTRKFAIRYKLPLSTGARVASPRYAIPRASTRSTDFRT